MSDLVQRLKSALADRYAIDQEVGSGLGSLLDYQPFIDLIRLKR